MCFLLYFIESLLVFSYWFFVLYLIDEIERQLRIDNLCTIAAFTYLELAETSLASDVVRQSGCHRLHGIAVRDGVWIGRKAAGR